MGVIAKGIPRGCQGLFTPVSLGYPLSVFNKNSTLKHVMCRLGLLSTIIRGRSRSDQQSANDKIAQAI